MTNFRVLLTFILALMLLSAVPLAHAQAPAVQKAFEEVKTKLDDLVSAKDEDLADNLALRIQAFKKVVEFSAEEAKTTKVKLLSTKLEGIDDETLTGWKARVEQKLVDAETHYEEVLGSLTTTTVSLDLAGLKTLASAFKEWRDASLAPLSEEIGEFLLVAGQAHALEVTAARFTKIESDVAKLERAKIRGVGTLSTLLEEARTNLEEASDAYARARALFATAITPPPTEEMNSGDGEGIAIPMAEPSSILGEAGTSTPASEEETPLAPTEASDPTIRDADEIEHPRTIRDEIRASLDGVKQAYRAFIEMSVEVKKILK